MEGIVEKIFVAPRGGVDMTAVPEVEAVAGEGLQGDRYALRNGHWSRTDECQITLIQGEHLDEIHEKTGIKVHEGEHRRNLVVRGIRLSDLAGRRFRVGEAVLEFDRPRPPCRYVESLTESGMTRALFGRGGICARVVKSGIVRARDAVELLESVQTTGSEPPSARQ